MGRSRGRRRGGPTGLAVFFAIVSIGMQIVAPDVAWTRTRWGNDMSGEVSERTEGWETGWLFIGIILIGCGVAMLALIASIEQPTRPRGAVGPNRSRDRRG